MALPSPLVSSTGSLPSRLARSWLPFFVLLCVGAIGVRQSRAEATNSGVAILQDLKAFREMGSVLHVAAHPDDENTQLLTYFSRGRLCRTAYLSLTRGDGGQNSLGPELGAELGVARTQELLAARRLDGAQQFFTRALDFGFSKDYRETLDVWDHQQVLADIVRVIRIFRPDVVITRFSPQPSTTHGHHTASAYLAVEAFKLAGDPKAFPEQLTSLTPWQPKRILLNGGGGGRGGGGAAPGALQLDIAGTDPVTGESFGAIAGRSRSMHKTQGFGNFNGGGGGPRSESFQLLGGEPAKLDVFDGIDTTWARVPGGAEIGKLVDEAITQYKPTDPAASAPALLKIRSRLAALAPDPLLDGKRRQLDHILATCLGISVETTVAQVEAVPGEKLSLQHTAKMQSAVPVIWKEIRYPASGEKVKLGLALKPNEAANRSSTTPLPLKTSLSQPYWLREPTTAGMFQVNDPTLIGRPENLPAFPVEYAFEVGDQSLVVEVQPVEAGGDPTQPQMRRHLEVVPPATVHFISGVELFAPGSNHQVTVEVNGLRPNVSGSVGLDAPAGWIVSPAKQSIKLEKIGDQARIAFIVTAPAKSAEANLSAHLDLKSGTFGSGRVEIKYAHLPLLLLQPAARVKVVSLEMANRARKVGYLPGAGDSVAEDLEQMGCMVKRLTGADLTPEGLQGLDAVVIGIRALNTREDLAGKMPALFTFAEEGGTVIAQYNRPEGLKVTKFSPYDLKLSNERVCEEKAVVTLLAPENPVLNVPNKITAADFDGWVQERGSYFPNQWDDHFVPILSCSDTGETQKSGGLLVANYGKGYFVYTGLTWFRQLPAGVPGAYRLFANLLSLGK